MAQTKKQRFKEQKRQKKKPAPVAQKTTTKSSNAASNGPNKVLLGVGALAVLVGVAVAGILVFNPFGDKAVPEAAVTPSAIASATAAPVAELPANDPRRIRMTLIKDYRIMVDSEASDTIAASCDSGTPVEVSARSMEAAGGSSNSQFSVLCTSTELKITDIATQQEVVPQQQ